ncbi:MAG TPA: NAD(P)H-dependent oxidoreductase [Clostridia bacterium]|nr:NAD(P)H-dependent oxidoreductase [Clostridia bacterium]
MPQASERVRRILAISCANIVDHRSTSASTRTCRLAAEEAARQSNDARTDILALVDLDLHPCTMCGACLRDPAFHCVDEDFNTLLDATIAADAVVMVIPHYAGLPSKLVMVMEKLQELAFLLGENGRQKEFPLRGKPVALVGHGGMVEDPDALEYYRKALLGPVQQALGSIGMKIVPAGARQPWGVTFGITGMNRAPGTFVSEMEHDWDRISSQLRPLVTSLLAVAR